MRGILRQYVPADERVILSFRPSVWFIAIRAFWPAVLVTSAAALARYAAVFTDSPDLAVKALWTGTALITSVLAWQFVQWLSRLYVLTERRLMSVAGLLLQNVVDVPLRNVRNVVLVRGVVERLTGLATLGAATAGTDGYELVWVLVPAPDKLLGTVRAAVDRAAERPKEVIVAAPPGKPIADRPLVIGLVGGIGAGKSEVARCLGEHGYVVIDSDKEAKAALDRPDVREELVKWWGERVLSPDGRIDRRAVASIVFSDAAERSRLEQLVHPLVKANRAELVDRAAREGKPGVVVDAPLLIEAGSDKKCDVIVFVDSPRDQRLARVQTTRRWDAAELERRENAQLPLEEKRRRADEVVVNDSTPEVLRRRVSELVQKIETRAR
jgi:dephospho-CoA kinase